MRDPEPGTSELRVGLRLVAVLVGIAASALAFTIPFLAVLLAGLYLGAALRHVDVRTVLRRNLPVLPIIVSLIVVHGWANPANVHWIGWFGIEGLTFGLVVSLRLLCFLAVLNIFLVSTPIHEIVRWTRDRNRDLGLMVSMAFTVTPILAEQMTVTLEAQQVRGMPVGPGIVAKVRAYTQVLIPVVVKALTSAEQMSLLIVARGYERAAAATPEDTRGADMDARALGFAYKGAEGWSLRDVDLTARAGRITSVLGGSGAGKSTLLACLAGDPPETPSGFVDGEALIGGLGYSPERPFATLALQNPGIHLFETPLAEVAFSFECQGMRHAPAAAAARTVLMDFGVGHLADRQLRSLSGGEKQRVALSAAFATRPAAIALDEPYEQLDAEGTADVEAKLRSFASSGRAVLLATRSRDVAARADAEYGLRSGRIVDPATALTVVPENERLAVLWGPPALTVQGATFHYPQGGGVEAFSMQVCAGETVALLGPNGAGKSTVLRLCVGLIRPQDGSVRLLGDDPAAIGPRELSRRAAMLFQDPDDQIFNPRVDEEIGWALKLRGVAAQERGAAVQHVLCELGLERHAGTHPHELSRSVRQLVALGSALVTEPQVLFLDEPTTALDDATAALAFAAIARRRVSGAAVVLVTHDEDVATRWADRVVRIEGGRVAD